MAHHVATGSPHPLMSDFSFNRFKNLDYILETGTTTAR